MRTVVRLDDKTNQPATAVFYVGIVAGFLLLLYTVYQFKNDTLAPIVPWVLSVVCVGFIAVFSYMALNSKTNHTAIVALIDGKEVPIDCHSAEQLDELLDALTLAMDWHLGVDIIFESPRVNHVRQGYAKSRSTDDEDPDDAESRDASKASTAAKHPSRVEMRKAQILTVLMEAWRKKRNKRND